ncbi:transporter substrate-binding domain-containing protein [Marinivivus vitaminiproducens]|uniref:transporter substrate-binding domain-containing protein n=1 Tax=Marinivivus vitaminiproducens TaxID=3035935 RepID=UPI00279E42FC|nr:transporter substrate-binding domain-containing protein [Geminicoccaceae bacterium SCSIO 64248]
MRTSRPVAPALLAASLLVLSAATAFAQSPELPAAPQWLTDADVLRVGVKCDYPPDGYLDMSGVPQGVEVSLARQIAEYALGDQDKAELSCVTAANRIPALTGGRADLVIATIGVTAERAEVIDFSDPYAWGGSDLLVASDSGIDSLEAMRGKTIAAAKGAWQVPWFEQHQPETEILQFDSVSDGLQALLQGRVQGFAHDKDVLIGLDVANDNLQLVGEPYIIGNRAAGIAKGHEDFVAYVNAAIAKAKADGLVGEWIEANVKPELQTYVKDSWDMSKEPKVAD